MGNVYAGRIRYDALALHTGSSPIFWWVEFTSSKFWNWSDLGCILASLKSFGVYFYPDLDSLDAPTIEGRSADEFVLEISNSHLYFDVISVFTLETLVD